MKRRMLQSVFNAFSLKAYAAKVTTAVVTGGDLCPKPLTAP